MKTYTLDDLVYLMTRLRDPERGCPWDVKQDWQSIVPHTLEEVYEVVEAIENRDWSHVEEELGDLLFHIIFYCQFAREEDRFSLESLIDKLVKKLLRRHPHVFPDGTFESWRDSGEISEEQINQNWELIKLQEKPEVKKDESALAGVPSTFPALQRAFKLQKKAARVGFDWTEKKDVLGMLRAEIEELEEALDAGDSVAVEDELGDVFFTLVNLSRHLAIDPESCLRQSAQKFESRFRKMEQIAQKSQKDLANMSLSEQEQLWQHAKQMLAEK
ncbi:nucleoside triphosphate pyrophosphohydrolase [Gynuella sunshinyii]|uniref:Nucleoside triphosphate pyrophosphohydrolase n=1 Tax=Gynuella sunshinyii YC6258 TaxID=1445510 RepID=A0A0C5VIP7_9GAMM|nr:nucleoside triphosphate pyrophosphohydrolase [Gynuella sunshinyii]AJQ94547.1 protein containing tetrapyrrole methyltransferase domain and MazG-like (predicted pyrophosphatase) domain [Gynuella sunshinyii YC6258]